VRVSGLGRLALTVASGLVYGLAFPPHSHAALAWVALVPFFLALRGASVRAALGLGWLWSMLAAWSVGEWMPAAVETYYLQPRIVGYGVFALVATLMVAPYHTAFALAYRVLARRSGAPFVLVTAAAWTGAELLRGRLFTGTPLFIGNPWALLGYSQPDALALLQVADLAGVYGVGFVLAAANAGLTEALVAWHAGRRGEQHVRRGAAPGLRAPLVAGAAPAALALAYGAWCLRLPVAGEPGVHVAVVQGDVAVGSLWRPEKHAENLDVYLAASAAPLANGAAIVVWPESATTFFLEQEPLLRVRIAAALAPTGAELVLGSPRAGPDGQPPYLNSVYVLEPDARLAARYDKQLLVPFAEHFPFGGIDFLRRRFARVREFAPGPASAALPTRAGPAGVLVCNEAMLPEVARARVEGGAAWLVSPSNDSWVPSPDFAELQFDVVRLRAIEQRRFLVRASTSGPSAIVDPQGRVLARTRPFERAAIEGTIAPETRRSVYSRIGDAFAIGCLLATALALVSSRSAAPPPAAAPPARGTPRMRSRGGRG